MYINLGLLQVPGEQEKSLSSEQCLLLRLMTRCVAAPSVRVSSPASPMFVRICTMINVHIYTCTNITFVCVYACVCRCVCVCLCVCVCVCVCVYLYVYIHTHTYICMCIHTGIYIYIYKQIDPLFRVIDYS